MKRIEFFFAVLALLSGVVACTKPVISSQTDKGEDFPVAPIFDPTVPDGALPGIFTVDFGGKQVYFSKGNLWYGKASVDATYATFNFENNQWEFSPTWDKNHLSHFYWSKDASAACEPEYTDDGATALFTNDDNFKVGNAQDVAYRSLSRHEWAHLIDEREASAIDGTENARFAKATIIVDGNTRVTGLILFPDVFSVPEDVKSPSGINTERSSFDTNSYTIAEWKKFEAAGAVFLPAAGFRENRNIYNNVGVDGYYYSSSPHDSNTGHAHALYFNGRNVVDAVSSSLRNYGCCIRLVTECQFE